MKILRLTCPTCGHTEEEPVEDGVAPSVEGSTCPVCLRRMLDEHGVGRMQVDSEEEAPS